MRVTTINLDDYILQRRPKVGQRIRDIRASKGWTQEQVAHYLGCSRRRVNRVEQGITDFGLFELELLAQVFEVSIACFLEPASV